MDSDRRSFFFGATLSEIGFILFFALLLFSFFERKADQEAIRVAAERASELALHIEATESALAELKDAMTFDSQEARDIFFDELVPRKELTVRNNELTEQNEKLQLRLADFSEIRDALESAAEQGSSAQNEIEKALQLKGALDAAVAGDQEIDPQMVAEALSMREVVDDFNINSDATVDSSAELMERLEQSDRVIDLEGQVQNLRGRLGGRDLPPCWAARNTGKIEYLFDVTILDEGLEFKSAAPPYRAQEYTALPNIDALTNGPIQLGRFKTLAGPILKLSDDKQCRHYVIITDRSQNAYKEATLTIEEYFYKFVNRT
jgi:hypothetical protein